MGQQGQTHPVSVNDKTLLHQKRPHSERGTRLSMSIIDSTEPRVVLCMKWGPLYPSSYVNVLYHAACKHLAQPFRFVCLTNEPDGLHPKIEHFPIPDLKIPETWWYNGAWPKIAVFEKQLYNLHGRCLFIDLDSMINASLAPFFESTADLQTIDTGENWRPGSAANHAPLAGTGVFTFTLGSLSHIVDTFREDQQAIIAEHKIEQVFVQSCVPQIAYWPPDWVISFKRHLRRPLLVDRFQLPSAPPKSCKIVAFHGDPRPIELVKGADHRWAKFPHYGKGIVPWMADYWSQHADSGN